MDPFLPGHGSSTTQALVACQSELKKMKLVGKLRPSEQKGFIELPELSSSSDSESSGSPVCWNINVSSYGIGDGP